MDATTCVFTHSTNTWKQNRIYPIGGLEDVEVDLLEGKTYVDFEVTKIMDEKYPYPMISRIDKVMQYGIWNIGECHFNQEI